MKYRLPTFRKRGLTLVPVDHEARDIMASLDEGQSGIFEYRKPRNARQHRAYFAMLNNVVEASGEWPSRARLELDIAIVLGAGDWIETRGGRTFVPHSRAVASMPRAEFEELHSKTVELLTQWLGCSPEALRDEAA